jgi:phosphoribosylamine-glycine ligase
VRVAFYTKDGSALAWSRRLLDEGCEVLVYIPKSKHGNSGKGLVPITNSKDTWKAWGSQKPDTLFFFDQTDDGDFAESLRAAGKLVINSGVFMDRLEKDREFGEKIAASIGMKLPPSKSFPTISAAIAFLETNPKQQAGDGGWAWKPNRNLGSAATFVGKTAAEVTEFLGYAQRTWGDNVSCILQEKIAGVALSTARWFNGAKWASPVEATLEKKKFLNGEKGPATGCALNLIWFYQTDTPRVAKECKLAELEAELLKRKAPPGLYDINSIVDHRGAWFLEWTPRLGIDSELTSQRGISSLSGFLYALATGGETMKFFDRSFCYTAVRLSVPPYPTEDKLAPELTAALNVPVRGADGLWDKFFVMAGVELTKDGLQVADPFGIVGVACVRGRSLKQMCDKIYSYLDKQLRIANLQYRTDAYEVIKKDLLSMAATGWESTPVLKVS